MSLAVETPQHIRDWAAAVAAKLRPLDDDTCRQIGRIARDLDATRRAAAQR